MMVGLQQVVMIRKGDKIKSPLCISIGNLLRRHFPIGTGGMDMQAALK